MPNHSRYSKMTEEQREKKRELHRKWSAKNRDKEYERIRKWQAENREKSCECSKKWYAENREKTRERIRKNAQACRQIKLFFAGVHAIASLTDNSKPIKESRMKDRTITNDQPTIKGEETNG